ncbi:hypothetical protein BPNPMPFG_002492 [Mesorhizobium sp. AR07]|uniref:hypothetical protein n=1 Tax=Mesorhizobium sp. AR07 TaxID=2865838 RepID=UPI00215DD738|nr:hypothetical protein [Mesorhizobium sp. AR07]UVK46783.1 hypothetical protein BPNPMPFG_002492 [Mesorhizobium sp. AR07]
MKQAAFLIAGYVLGVASLTGAIVLSIQVNSYDCTRQFHTAACEQVAVLPWESR